MRSINGDGRLFWIALTLHLHISARVPSFPRMSNVTRRVGPGACFGMGGNLRLALVKEVAFGLLEVEMLLCIGLSALLARTLSVYLFNEIFLME